jgi:glycerate dehydrogenase
MHIVVVDGYTLNPGDLSWEALFKLGDCEIYDRTAADDVVKRIGDAEIVLTNKVALDEDILSQLPKIKYIGVLATGVNVVDVQAASKRKIIVTNVPTYGTQSVAQMVFAHILNLTQRVAHHSSTVTNGKWSGHPDFCYWDFPLIELSDLTMGIIGYGRIGRATAQLALAFGMTVLAHDLAGIVAEGKGIKSATLEEVFGQSDIISLHCPLTPQTDKIINAEHLNLMKPSAFLINTSRGGLIDEAALAEALNSGRIAGAGLDVLSQEPPKKDNPLLSAKNCTITPHIAWATAAARSRLMQTAIDNLRAFLTGQPVNVVNRAFDS